MPIFNAMAFGGCGEDVLKKKMLSKKLNDGIIHIVEENISQNDLIKADSENTLDDYVINSDSLSSSASISDSDLTSTDSDDSLVLSESESITDVTPLNSPYCDSPLPQSKLSEPKLEDKNVDPSRNVDCAAISEGPPEMNVLMQAIEKLEIEAKKADNPSALANSQRTRTILSGAEEGKRIEQENQRLYKRVIAQQSRIKSLYPSTTQSCQKNLRMSRYQVLVKSGDDISVSSKNSQSSKGINESAKHIQRQQKRLSHPTYIFSSECVTNKVTQEDISTQILKPNSFETKTENVTSVTSAKNDTK